MDITIDDVNYIHWKSSFNIKPSDISRIPIPTMSVSKNICHLKYRKRFLANWKVNNTEKWVVSTS